MYIYVIQ